MNRRAVLIVPASEPRKIAKALAHEADEVIVDLEDAVAVDDKVAARQQISALAARDSGLLGVRVNAVGTPWFEEDLAVCVGNAGVASIVVPKSERAADLRNLATRLDRMEAVIGRREPLRIQALIESPAGVCDAAVIANATSRMAALIIGYADLSAATGRRLDSSWQFAQDTVLFAARAAGVQAVDGPLLTIAADDALHQSADRAAALGFDGKWVIHPGQVASVQRAFAPSEQEVDEAREIIAVMSSAAIQGRGALKWRGRMLDEAVAARARRTMERAYPQ